MRIRFQPELVVKPDKPAKLIVRFRVDNAPPEARLLFSLGHFENGKFKSDVEDWGERAQLRHIGFDPKGKGGALLFEAAVSDWTKEFDVAGLADPGISSPICSTPGGENRWTSGEGRWASTMSRPTILKSSIFPRRSSPQPRG